MNPLLDTDHPDYGRPETVTWPKRCELCGERVRDDQAAEMFDPNDNDSLPVFCHVECGLARGLEVA